MRACARATGADTDAPGRCGRPPRKPGDLSPASHDNPRGKGGFNAKTRSNSGWRPRARWPSFSSSRPPRSRRPRRSPPTCAWSAPAARSSPKKRCSTGTTKVPTSPKATCFGSGSGGSGKAMTVKGATALGLLAQAAKSDARAAAAATSPTHFSFGLGALQGRRHVAPRRSLLVPEGQPQGLRRSAATR